MPRALIPGLFILVLLTLFPAQAWTQELRLQAQQAQPVPGGDYNGAVFVEGAALPPPWRPTASLVVHHAYRPLALEDRRTGRSFDLLKHQLQADLLASVGVWENLAVGVALPVSLVQRGTGSEDVSVGLDGVALGDVRVTPKWSLRGSMPLGWNLALSAQITLPTGDASRLIGESGASVMPSLIGQWLWSTGTRVTAQLGYHIRPQQQVFDLPLGNQLGWGVAWHQALLPGVFGLGAEAYGRLPLDSDTSWTREATPAELLGVATFWLAPAHTLLTGAGPGLTQGFGSPTWRLFLGYRYSSKAQDVGRDLDGDGIEDGADACPDQPEDVDGFEDRDGCPDPDNDQDGVPDLQDACPGQPEDVDGFEDRDGCPDPDNDGDGLADQSDQCPNVPEDRDDVADEDGCPDLDDDGDGIKDGADACPDQPEDVDGFEDEDGCPDPDNDGDGVPDLQDECPQDQEIYNGVKDQDGCPDASNARVEWTRARILLKEEIYFNFNRAKLQDRSRPILRKLAKFLADHPEIERVEIQGHTDDRGTEAWNMDLSWRRAEIVRTYLLRQGVAPQRLVVIGFGKTRPLEPGRSQQARSRNRRVEFRILKLKKAPTQP